jgi:hypothetical protein
MGGLCSAVPMARFSTATAGTTGGGSYLLVEPSPARERARLAIRALLKEQLGPSPSEVDVAMKRGLEGLLW